MFREVNRRPQIDDSCPSGALEGSTLIYLGFTVFGQTQLDLYRQLSAGKPLSDKGQVY